MFVRPPKEILWYPHGADENNKYVRQQEAFVETAVRLFNRIICEFALYGVVSEPATPVHVSEGRLREDQIVIMIARGGRELYRERTVGPYAFLRDSWRGFGALFPLVGAAIVEAVVAQGSVTRLVDVSETLPLLVAGTYFLYSRQQIAEAIVDSWIANEQIIDSCWGDYVSVFDRPRRKRLEDTRTYTAAVQIEVLHTAGRIPDGLYRALNDARKVRNDLAHRAKLNREAATAAVTAMKQMIEHLLERPVAPLDSNIVIVWDPESHG
jgi:hypothetical protein